MRKYFEVNTKCGHVGKNKCINISFAVEANNAKEAANVARNFKRVKHDHKDAINYVNEISYEQYLELCEINHNDKYLQCSSIQEQRLIECFDERIEDNFYYKELYKFEDKQNKRESVNYRLLKDKILLTEFCSVASEF